MLGLGDKIGDGNRLLGGINCFFKTIVLLATEFGGVSNRLILFEKRTVMCGKRPYPFNVLLCKKLERFTNPLPGFCRLTNTRLW